MAESAITLLKSRPNWKGIRWNRGPQIRRVDDLDQITRAMSAVGAAAASIARIIIEEPIDGTAFLNLITSLPPEFLGDVLLIMAPGRAFLSSHMWSAAAPGGVAERYLYLLDQPGEIDSYLDAWKLREEGFEGEAPKPQRLRVLVAEDERKTREFLVSILQKAGCDTTVATTGFEAVKIAQERRPQILLLDGLLPEMHGFEVARFVRGIDRDYRPRIVIVTAVYKHTRYQSEAKLRYGVDLYLVKPVTREQIANVVFGEITG